MAQGSNFRKNPRYQPNIHAAPADKTRVKTSLSSIASVDHGGDALPGSTFVAADLPSGDQWQRDLG